MSIGCKEAVLASTSQALHAMAGWARTLSKARKRFSQQVKDLLLAQFMVAANSGKKESPETVLKRLESRLEKGLQKDDCLTVNT